MTLINRATGGEAYQALWGEQGGFVDGDHGERKLAEKLSHVAAQ